MNQKYLFLLILGLSMIFVYGEPDNSIVTLLPGDATIEGTVRLMHHPERLGFWSRKKDRIFFSMPSLKAGNYDVEFEYAVGDAHGGRASIVIGDVEFKKVFLSTGGFTHPKTIELGQIQHEGGPLDIRMKILRLEHHDRAILDFYSMKFIKRQKD